MEKCVCPTSFSFDAQALIVYPVDVSTLFLEGEVVAEVDGRDDGVAVRRL